MKLLGDSQYKIECTDVTRSLKYDIICLVSLIAEFACAVTWFLTGMDRNSYIIIPVLIIAGIATLSIYKSTNPEPFKKVVKCSGTESTRADMLEKNICEALKLTHEEANEKEIKELEKRQYDKSLRDSLKSLRK